MSTPKRLEHFGREDLAHAAFQREPAVALARPGRAPTALGAEIKQPLVPQIAQLREEKTATVAEIGIVGAELMAVIAQRQRFGERARQRLEPAEMVDPLRVGQVIEADARGPALVAIAQHVLGKLRRRHLVEEAFAQRRVQHLGLIGRGRRHGA